MISQNLKTVNPSSVFYDCNRLLAAHLTVNLAISVWEYHSCKLTLCCFFFNYPFSIHFIKYLDCIWTYYLKDNPFCHTIVWRLGNPPLHASEILLSCCNFLLVRPVDAPQCPIAQITVSCENSSKQELSFIFQITASLSCLVADKVWIQLPCYRVFLPL